jgi:hypothetical protein
MGGLVAGRVRIPNFNAHMFDVVNRCWIYWIASARQFAAIGNRTTHFLPHRRDHLIQIEREFMQKEQVTLPLGLEAKPAPIDND